MGMNISSGGSSEPEVMIEMNMTPLIDVMLVLIVTLIITIPIQNHAVNLNLPNGAAPPPEPPRVVSIDIDFDGTILWDGVIVPTYAQLESKLRDVAAIPEQPEVHLRPNKLVAYKSVASVMAAAQRNNVTKIGMVGNEQFVD
jgi:biopolymer transport protein ExbD